MVSGNMNVSTLNSNNINLVTPSVTYDLQYTTPTKMTSSVDLSGIQQTNSFYNIDVLPNENVSRIQLVTKNLNHVELPTVDLNLNGKNIMTTSVDAINSCSFMLDSKKIESLEIKLDKLCNGMLYIIYEHTLLPDVSNTTLTLVQ